MEFQKGEAAFYQHNGLVGVKYRAMKDRAAGNSKEVYVLRTSNTPAMGHTNKRDKDGNVIEKPTCINTYNHSMRGVDLIDEQHDGIDVLRKSYKWYKKLFLRLLRQCALSAHRVYRLNGKYVFYTFSLMYVLHY